jgi:hypothetical protein
MLKTEELALENSNVEESRPPEEVVLVSNYCWCKQSKKQKWSRIGFCCMCLIHDCFASADLIAFVHIPVEPISLRDS